MPDHRAASQPPRVVVVTGVMGSGKTTVGRRLAESLKWTFYDADDFHPPANVDRLARGVPLTDDDRAPWIAELQRLIAEVVGGGRSAVLACSGLRAWYRAALVPPGAPPGTVRFVYLKSDPALIADRLRRRDGHFADPALLPSQFAALEEPTDAITVDAHEHPEALVARITQELDAPCPPPSSSPTTSTTGS